MIEPVRQIPPQQHAGHRPQDLYRLRGQLTAGERALLDLIANLARRNGTCHAGERFLADALECTDRWVRSLLGRLRGKGYVAIIHRAGRKSLVKVLHDRPPEPPRSSLKIGPAKLTPRNDRSGPPRNDRSAPGRNDRSALTRKGTPNTWSAEEAAALGPLFDRRPKRFNPLAPRSRGGTWDDRRPERRLADAVREGQVLYVQHARRQRVIERVTYNPTQVFLQLLSEREGDEVQLIVPICELGGRWFGR